jgi:flagellar biosynthesis/type III secretory pathway protein FliH
MTNNKQQTAVKLYTEEQVREALRMTLGSLKISTENDIISALTHIELPSDEEIEEKLNVAYGNGYEQGEMDFYKKMQVKGNQYADGYAEGYQRALELVKFQIVEQLEARR